MFRDCFRCGHVWRIDKDLTECPICTGVPDHVAQYIKDMRDNAMELRSIARIGIASPNKLSAEDLIKIGFLVS